MRKLVAAVALALVLAGTSMAPTPALADSDEPTIYSCEMKAGPNLVFIAPKKQAHEFAKDIEKRFDAKCKKVKD